MKTAAIKILSFALISGIMLSAVGCRRTVKIAGNGSDYASEYWITEEVDAKAPRPAARPTARAVPLQARIPAASPKRNSHRVKTN